MQLPDTSAVCEIEQDSHCSSEPMHIKVSIVDDDKDLRASLATLIRGTDSLRLVGSYANAKIALEEFFR